jgi:hypothetical protein
VVRDVLNAGKAMWRKRHLSQKMKKRDEKNESVGERSSKQRQDGSESDAPSIKCCACSFRHGFPLGLRGDKLLEAELQGLYRRKTYSKNGDFSKKKNGGRAFRQPGPLTYYIS